MTDLDPPVRQRHPVLALRPLPVMADLVGEVVSLTVVLHGVPKLVRLLVLAVLSSLPGSLHQSSLVLDAECF